MILISGIPAMRQETLWDPCALITIGPFRWFVHRKPEDLVVPLFVLFLKKWYKQHQLEIQQQMQDNIKWIKGAQGKQTTGSQARIYADAEGRENCRSFNQAIAKRKR
jgi:urocanate hydratase